MTSGNTLTKICFNFIVFRIVLAWNSHFLLRFIFFYTRNVDLVVFNASFNVLFYVCLTPKVQVQHFSLFASLSLFSCFCFEFFLVSLKNDFTSTLKERGGSSVGGGGPHLTAPVSSPYLSYSFLHYSFLQRNPSFNGFIEKFSKSYGLVWKLRYWKRF